SPAQPRVGGAGRGCVAAGSDRLHLDRRAVGHDLAGRRRLVGGNVVDAPGSSTAGCGPGSQRGAGARGVAPTWRRSRPRPVGLRRLRPLSTPPDGGLARRPAEAVLLARLAKWLRSEALKRSWYSNETERTYRKRPTRPRSG